MEGGIEMWAYKMTLLEEVLRLRLFSRYRHSWSFNYYHQHKLRALNDCRDCAVHLLHDLSLSSLKAVVEFEHLGY